MKYLLLIDHIATGGAERILIDYYHHLKAGGHEPYIFVLSGYEGQSEWTKGLQVYYGSGEDKENLLKKTMQQIGLYLKLKRLVKEIKPDVLFSFLEKSNLLTVLVHSKVVKIVSVHNVLSIQYTKVRSNLVRKILYGMIRWMYNHCQNVVAVSKQVKDDLVASFGVKEEHIRVINNYVDKEEVKRKSNETVANYVFKPNVNYVMNIGRFSDQKAQWKLIKAFSLYLGDCKDKEHVRLVLMGKGEYEEALKQLAADLNISDNVTFLPFNVNPYKYMAHARLFVLSSIFEGFPIVLAEVSSLRIPFVGSRKAIPEEMFTDNAVWEKCVFETLTLEKDFSATIHGDEKQLAGLIRKGVEDEAFRKEMLSASEQWEQHNAKSFQFQCYDRLANGLN